MIPVRVPVDAPTYLVGGEMDLSPDHPLYRLLDSRKDLCS